MRRRKRSWVVVGAFPAAVLFGSVALAATFDVQKAKNTTQQLTRKNATALIGVSSAVPDELRIEVIEIIQALELSRDRILLFIDRVGEGVFPPEEGARRATGIAETAAQREREFLQKLMTRVPDPVVAKVENALAVSGESWKGLVSAFRLTEKEEARELPSRPSMDFFLAPAGPGPVSPADE
ncbi:MAG TPA: hypothetical protein VFF51_04935 [Candidatus Methylomirabilis sp.]|nr:hypothetical protein [Candidatus Methylomirabilis sp.]